jgi:hypothetical protein
MDKQYEVIHIPEIERRNNVIAAAVAGLENSVANMRPMTHNVVSLFESKKFGVETEPAPTPAQQELSAERGQVEASYDIAA